MRRAGNKLKVTAQLTDPGNGFNLWSESYDRELNDAFAVQEDIGKQVASSLKVTLLGAASHEQKAGNPEAYNLYLQGRYWLLRANKQNLEKAQNYFQQAVKLDPKYAPGWQGLSATFMRQADVGDVPAAEGSRKAREMAERALTLDPDLADAHSSMGWIKMSYDWDWEGADASYQRALALDPGSVATLGNAAGLEGALGHFDAAISLYRKAAALDPLRPVIFQNLGVVLYYAGKTDEGLRPSTRNWS